MHGQKVTLHWSIAQRKGRAHFDHACAVCSLYFLRLVRDSKLEISARPFLYVSGTRSLQHYNENTIYLNLHLLILTKQTELAR